MGFDRKLWAQADLLGPVPWCYPSLIRQGCEMREDRLIVFVQSDGKKGKKIRERGKKYH